MERNTDAFSSPRVRAEQGRTAVRDAAAMWARATARRDRLPVAPSLEDKLPGIESALAHDGAQLLIVRPDGKALGFALVAPREDVLEVLYLAVDPDAWGTGIARQLLTHLRHHSATVNKPMELWVIADNTRAIAAYESAGWSPTSDLKVRNCAGRVERRYTLFPP